MVFFHEWNEWKNTQINYFSSQNICVERIFFTRMYKKTRELARVFLHRVEKLFLRSLFPQIFSPVWKLKRQMVSSWLCPTTNWKMYVIMCLSFSKNWNHVSFIVSCHNKRKHFTLIIFELGTLCRAIRQILSYFLHWNFNGKSCFVVFFHEWNESKNPKFNFSSQNLG